MTDEIEEADDEDGRDEDDEDDDDDNDVADDDDEVGDDVSGTSAYKTWKQCISERCLFIYFPSPTRSVLESCVLW